MDTKTKFEIEASKDDATLAREDLADRFEDAKQDAGAVRQDARKKLRDHEKQAREAERAFVSGRGGFASLINTRLAVASYKEAMKLVENTEAEFFGA